MLPQNINNTEQGLLRGFTEYFNQPFIKKPILDLIKKYGGGGGGGSPDNTFIFEQNVSTNLWTINHNFDTYPVVQVYVGNERVEADVKYINSNTLTINFSQNQTGIAIIQK